jgi:hypothetical protein
MISDYTNKFEECLTITISDKNSNSNPKTKKPRDEVPRLPVLEPAGAG